jgi:AraC family transcriptional regulator
VWIGRFRCAPEHGLFADSGPASAHLFVFPRTSVRISHVGRDEFLSSRNVVTFYNPGDEYRRGPVSPEGDECDWFAMAPELARSVVSRENPRAAEGGARVFRFDHGPCDGASYQQQRVLASRAALGASALEVEEGAVRILARLIRSVHGQSTFEGGRPLRAAHRELADAARQALAARLAEPLSLEHLARALGCSAYHLCRVFRHATATSLHEYRSQLRLRRGVDLIEGGAEDLTRIALELGYSSHSHFSHAFRRAFGVTPTQFRGAIGRGARTRIRWRSRRLGAITAAVRAGGSR